MKRKKLKKLALNKQVMTRLSRPNMLTVKGGATVFTCTGEIQKQ